MNTWDKLVELNNKTKINDKSQFSSPVLSILSHERENVLKKAREGFANSSEMFFLLREKPLRNSVSYVEVELVMKRLAINLSEHRFAEILSGAKLLSAQQSHGFTKINFGHVEELEFENIFVYLEATTISMTKSELDLSVKYLLNFSLVMIFLFLLSCLIVSNLAVYYFQGEFLGSAFCFFIPTFFLVIFRSRNAIKSFTQQEMKAQIDLSFEQVTNSKAEIVI